MGIRSAETRNCAPEQSRLRAVGGASGRNYCAATLTTATTTSAQTNGSTAPAPIFDGEELLAGGSDLLQEGGPLAEACRYAVSTTGKQLRSRLVLAAARCGAADDERVRSAARAVELLHAATLAHDDVVDDSDLRRGRPSVSASLGGFAAGYTGGWLFGSAIDCAAQCGQEGLAAFAETVCDLCDGEMLETRDLYNTDRAEERYLEAIRGKTAVVFSVAARLGGLAAGVPAAAVEDLAGYGMDLGMAFQIADDVLDIVADHAVTGKQPGDDLRHGVYTLPVIHALAADKSLRERLSSDVDEADLPGLVATVVETGGAVRALEACEEYAARAKAAAGRLNAPWLETFVDESLARLEGVREQCTTTA